MIEFLIGKGSDINRQDLEGFSPIHVAASNKTYTACLKLIELGADINLKTLLGQLPYDLAESGDVREVLRPSETPGLNLLTQSTSKHAIYIGYQEGDSNIYEPPQPYIAAHDSLMLDSNSEERLLSNPMNQIKIRRLITSEPEYQIIERRMMETIVCHAADSGGRFNSYDIVSIDQILHEKVWSRYRLMSKILELGKGPGRKNERLLFHGSNFIERIQQDGFDVGYAQRDGMFGAGIYFAEHSSKSNQYTFGWGQGCQKHNDKSCYLCERKLIYAQVNLGKSLRSKEAMPGVAHAPPGYASVTGCPETTGDLIYPEYVIYHGDQAYPLFVITYKIK